jgi:hypothetical protein
MRRWFALLLLALLPLQFVGAAVAPYCGHESDAQAQHLGHHEHHHEGAAQVEINSDATATAAQASGDMDCSHCHSSCCSMPAPAGPLVVHVSASPPVALIERNARSLVHTPPERPQWLRLA